MSEYNYWIVDVFTTTRFGGNQLAVIPDARGLDSETMQQIAREFNYSETTFVLPPDNPENSARFRIFTPTRELPFAGHPTVGTAWVLAQERGLKSSSELRLEAGVGLLKVQLTEQGASFQVAVQPEFSPLDVPLADLAQVLGLQPDQLGSNKPVVSSCGLPFALVHLQSLEAMAQARMTLQADDPFLIRWSALQKLYLYSFETVHTSSDVHARMYAPTVGVAEDPATGSAASALAAWLGYQETEDGEYSWRIEQGIEMGRPSFIDTRVLKAQRRLDVFVRGQVVSFSRGVLILN